jgi:hypothetical protein
MGSVQTIDRFRLYVDRNGNKRYLMAWYETDANGIIFTGKRADACQYALIEKAASVARELNKLHGWDVRIETGSATFNTLAS